MTKVVFVADEPSSTNVSPDIAFIGARCFDTVVKWIKELNPDYYVCLNSDTTSNLSDINKLYKVGFKVIAFGEKASKRLDNMNIHHVKLPHPSPKNRMLNNKQQIAADLTVAHDYILGLYEKEVKAFGQNNA